MSNDEVKAIKEFDKANEQGFKDVFKSQQDSEKAREKSARETSEQMKNDGASAKEPLDKSNISDEAKEEKKPK